jgi:hypothetical protein
MSFSLFSRVRRASTEVRRQQAEPASATPVVEVVTSLGPVELQSDELKLVGGGGDGDQSPKGGWIVPASTTTTTPTTTPTTTG